MGPWTKCELEVKLVAFWRCKQGVASAAFLAQAFLADNLFSTRRACDTTMVVVLSTRLQANRSLATLKAGSLSRAYLPNDARAKVFHGLGPGSSVTEDVLHKVLKELDGYLVVDDYGSVECVKFARDEYNKRPVGHSHI